MNFVPCLTWVAKGIAKSSPDKLQLSPEELKNLIEETKNFSRKTNCKDGIFDKENDVSEGEKDASEGEKDSPHDNVSDEEEDASDEEGDVSGREDDLDNKDGIALKEETDEDDLDNKDGIALKEEIDEDDLDNKDGIALKEETGGDDLDNKDGIALKEETDEDDARKDNPAGIENDNVEDETDNEDDSIQDDDEDFDSRYNLQAYDDDGEDEPFMNISDVTTFIDNKEDCYITGYDAIEEDDKEDEEDFIIKETDNLLLVGHIEEESSVLEVYVHNKEEDALYIHHDIVLPAYPLALEWLDFHPSDEAPGNYVAVGDMTSIIKIWDLDLVDILEPDFCLGKELKKKKMETMKLKYHTDAVLSLSWNKHIRNILASGSADSSIIIWDLQEAKPLNKLTYHTNKVQSLQWHPFESSFLLSGCTDGVVKLYDCRAPDAECKSWKIEGEIEKVAWNLTEPIKFLCSTDQGYVHSIDMKSDKIEHSIKAHSDAVTSLDMCPARPNILVTGSMDNTIKIWDLQKLSHVRTQKLKVGSIYTAKFAPDSELTLAVGGNCKSNSLKVMDLKKLLEVSKDEEEPTASVPKLGNKKNFNYPSNAKGGRNKEQHQDTSTKFGRNKEQHQDTSTKFGNKNFNYPSNAKGGRNKEQHKDISTKPFVKKFNKFSQPKVIGPEQGSTENFNTISASSTSHSKKEFNRSKNFKTRFADNKPVTSQPHNVPFKGKRIAVNQLDSKTPTKKFKEKHANRNKNNHIYFTDEDKVSNSSTKKKVKAETKNCT